MLDFWFMPHGNPQSSCISVTLNQSFYLPKLKTYLYPLNNLFCSTLKLNN